MNTVSQRHFASALRQSALRHAGMDRVGVCSVIIVPLEKQMRAINCIRKGMYKFQTMVPDATRLHQELPQRDDGPVLKIKNELRVTRLPGSCQKRASPNTSTVQRAGGRYEPCGTTRDVDARFSALQRRLAAAALQSSTWDHIFVAG